MIRSATYPGAGLFGLVAVVLTLFPLAVSPVSAQSAQRGRLEGVVRDTEGAPLPGVTVTATSAALQGQRQTATEVGGTYVLRDLPRGDYMVLFEFPGLQSIEQTVVIELSRTSRAEAVMDLAQFEDAMVVEAASPAVLDTTQGGANLTYDTVDSLPVERAPAIIAALAPGVGESRSYDQQVRISGGFVTQTSFLIEGHDAADYYGAPVAGVEIVTGPFIEDAVEETQVLSSAISAEHGRFGGGVVNMVTKSGGNELAGTFRVDFSNPSWRDETPHEERLGIKRESHRSEVLSATLGGPILKDKLWYFLAGRRNDESQTSTMAVSGAPRPSDFLETRYQVKLTGNLNDNHSLQATWIDAELDGFTAFPWVIDPRAAGPQNVPNDLLVLRYSGLVTPRLFVEGQVSKRDFAFEGQGRTDRDPTDPRNSPFYGFSEVGDYNHPSGNPEQPIELNSRRAAASLSWFTSSERLGSHDLKLGGEWFEESDIWGGSYSATDLEFIADYLADETGRPIYDEQGRFQPVFPNLDTGCCTLVIQSFSVPGASSVIETTAVYLNDRWVLNEHWSFNLGLRYEDASGRGEPGSRTVDASTLTPRLAVSLDPIGDGRFRFGAGYGEYSGKYNSLWFSWGTLIGGAGGVVHLYAGPEGEGLDFAPGFDLANYIPVDAWSPDSRQLAPGTESEITREWTLSAGMRLPRGGYLEAILVDREFDGLLQELFTLDNGTTTVELPGLVVVTDNGAIQNTSLAERTYRALQVQGRYRLSDAWTIDGNWTWQLEHEGNTEPDGSGGVRSQPLGDYPEIWPQERVAPSGPLTAYQRHRVRFWTNYAWSLGRAGDVDLSLFYRYDSPRTFSLTAPVPMTETQEALDPGYATPPMSEEIFFGRRGSQEFDASHLFDMAARYSIRAWRSVEPWIKLEVRNVFNDSSRIEWNTNVSADFDGPLDAYGLPTQYIEGPNFGETNVPEDYVAPREYRFSVGFRF